MSKNNNHIDFERIAAYLAGELTKEEKLSFENWLKESPENQQFYNNCKQIFDNSGKKGQIEEIDFDVNAAWQKVGAKLVDHGEPERKIRPLYYYISGVAASLLIFMVWFFTAYNSGTLEYSAENEILKVYLPDSSFAVLNIGSKITFEEDFGTEHRKLGMEGDVYFDVVKNDSLLFEIEATSTRVTVLGTAFLVEDSPVSTKVTVERGLVSMELESDTTRLFVKPNYQGSLFKSSKNRNVEKLSSLNHLYWANHKLVYRQENLSDIFDELSKIFNKRFDYDKDLAQICRISGIFREQNLLALLKNLALSTEFDFVINENSVQINSINCGNE